ncbi:MAG TPA: sulfotransferase [Azospirillum sp.]|nr:sulfotransferase [Azospirillum sp.]
MPNRLAPLDDRLAAVYARPLLLVVGAPHCGFEAARALLDSHPQLRLAPDGHFTDRFAVPLKDVVGDYNEGLEGGGAAFTQSDFLHLVRTAVALSLAKLEPEAGVRMIGCAAAVHAHNLDFWELMFPGLTILHVVRDGRTAVAAALDEASADPHSEAWYAAADAAAYAWTDATRTACGFGASRPERYFELRWEDLAADPHTHLGAALRFLELDVGSQALASCLARLPEPATPRTTLDGRAMQRLLQHQGPLLRQFGYAS